MNIKEIIKFFKKEQPKIEKPKVVKLVKYKTNIELMQRLANKKPVAKKTTNKLKKESELKQELKSLLGGK